MTGEQSVIIQAAIDTLRQHAPFDQIEPGVLAWLAGQASIAYYPKGRRIVGPEDGLAALLRVVQRGRVRHESPGRERQAGELGPGESFPLAEVLGGRPSAQVYEAAEDTFCYELPAAVVVELARSSPEFQRFCTDEIGALIERSQWLVQSLQAQQAIGQLTMHARLRTLVRRAPVTCGPQDMLKSAVARMREAGVGAIVVIDQADQPVGVFTERDLLRLAADGALDLSGPVSRCMTSNLETLPADATALDAAMLMARRGFRHVPVLEAGRLLGMVSERDLFALQRTSLRSIVGAIERARDESTLRHAAAEIAALASNLIAQGVDAEHLTQLVAILNDQLVARVLALEATRHDLTGISVCWIALGSEGRLEQTLATDQDNGIVFVSALEAPTARARLLPFAQAVNRTLDACGFPSCKGGIMAGNPQWCLSLDEWRACFADWIRNPVPQALLNAAIFFDLRPLWGEVSLARALRRWLTDTVIGHDRFLRALAQAALESRVPAGFFSEFLAAARSSGARLVDLKTSGTRPFVDAARILALAAGTEETNTAARLRSAGVRLRMPTDELEAMVSSFHFVLLLRLRHQMTMPVTDEAQPNRIDPDALNALDRRILKEAMRHARKLQDRLALDYRL